MPTFMKHAGKTASTGSGHLGRPGLHSPRDELDEQIENELADDIERTARERLSAGNEPPPDEPGERPSPSDYRIISHTESRDTQESDEQRFRQAFRKAVAIKKTILQLDDSSQWAREPGIDPKLVDLPDLKAPVVIQAVDFSREEASFHVLSNASLPAFLEQPRPDWATGRWLHVNGLSWDVIKPLAIKHDLHPLAIEDMLYHGTHTSRSKVDYYRTQMFVSLVVHKTLSSSSTEDDILAPGQAALKQNRLREQFGFSTSPERYPSDDSEDGHRDEESAVEGSKSATSTLAQYTFDLLHTFNAQPEDAQRPKPRLMTHYDSGTGMRRNRVRRNKKEEKHDADLRAAQYLVGELTKGVKVHVHVEQLSIFLCRDGTCISVSQDTGYHGRISEVFTRMQSKASIIRESEDPSFVLQALLDVCGDHALEIVDEFRDHLTALESKIMARPDMDDVRELHTLSAQLLLLRSNITPFYQLLHSIRTQDDAKAAAASGIAADAGKDGKRRSGFVSREAKVYLSDVMDHVESVLSSLDLFSNLAENLISWTFNSLNYWQATFIQALSVLSVIFLPLTFLASYFGQNFTQFKEINGSVSYFWKLAIPITVGTTILFGYQYILELLKQARKVLSGLRRRQAERKRKAA